MNNLGKIKMPPIKYKRVCYGILQSNGELWMSESCICEDKSVLLAEELESAPEGSKIVPLFVVANAK